MTTKEQFPLNPDAFGLKYLGKVKRFEEMTAADFDDLRNASLAERIGGDALVMYLECLDVANPEQGRSYFFTLDTRPVSKWARFIRSLKDNADITLRQYSDLVDRVLVFEEKTEEMGKRGRQQVLEVASVPSPEEIEMASRGKAAEEKAEEKPAPAAEARTDDYISELILSTADGLTRDELAGELKAMGVDEPPERIRELSNRLIAAGKVTFKDQKFSVS